MAFSQSNWTAIMTQGSGEQSYNSFDDLKGVEQFILEQAKKSKVVNEVVYGNGKWYAVASYVTTKTDISWDWDTKFPSEWVSKKWDAGQHISKVTYGNGNWFVITTNNTAFKYQSWATRYTWEDIEKFVKDKWKENTRYNITDLAYANGMWCVVLSVMNVYEKQSFKVSEDFPTKWIQDKYDEKYNITTIESDGEKWYVVMTQKSSQKGETIFIPEQNFPGTKIKEEWDKSRRISSLVFRDASKSNANLYKSYVELGDEKLDKKDYLAAIDYYDKALNLNASNEGIWNNRAWAKYLSGYCYSALSDINKSIEIKSTAYNNHTKGAILKCQNKCSEAIVFFNEAVRLYKIQYGNITNIAYYTDRADAKKCTGNYEGAIEDMELALKLEPNNYSLKNSLTALNDLLAKNTKPVITWDYPFEPSVETMTSTVAVKACISTQGTIRRKLLVVNGQEIPVTGQKGLGVEADCKDFISQNLSLRNGVNEVYIKVETTAGTEGISEKRRFVYSPASAKSNYYALMIAVEEYDDPAINPLNDPGNKNVGPVAELKALQRTLTSKYDFPESNVKFLVNPDKTEIINNLLFFNSLKPTDHFLLVYSGHGDTLGKSGFWLPRDAVKKQRKNYLSIGELSDYLQNINSKHTLVVADACFSGMLLQQGNKTTNETECNMANENSGFTALTSGAITPVPNSNLFMSTLTRLLDESTSCMTSEKLYFLLKQNMLSKSNVQNPQYGMLRLDQMQFGGHFTFYKK
jgi:tetratricopeptide (TPR) repeat protein